MKLLKLLEMPYLHSGEYDPDRPRRMSGSARERETKFLFSIQNVEFRMVNDGLAVLGFVHEPNDRVQSYRVVFHLSFKHQLTISKFPNDINPNDVIQINSVVADADYRSSDLCATVYEHLVRAGYVLMSDESQFTPAVHLWHKLIRRNNFPVYVIDVDNGFVSKDGQPIRYDGKNIKFEDIWTSGDDLSGMYKILVMKQ